MSAPAILEFRDVAFSHGEHNVLSGVNFAVRPGEMVALMGANGAGKTTLLRLAAGLLQPGAGDVLFQQRCIREWPRQLFARRVALVPQELEVPFAFRVEELVAQGRMPHLGFFGGLSAADRAAVEEAMEAVDLMPLRHRVFSELSGGEHQRVKLAIGLAQQPDVMLLDEPTQHLDLGRQIELMALLDKLVARGITIVAAIHDLALAREHGSSGVLLMPGGQAECGALESLLQPELLRNAFDVTDAALESYLGSTVAQETAGAGEKNPLRRPAAEHGEAMRRRHVPGRNRQRPPKPHKID
ncbi:MAG: ABC transporter ATP-binding protein [Acidobacteriota bacterium]|nr:ABC transporter ATP-binding protein [Acidobacteriota bacterium]